MYRFRDSHGRVVYVGKANDLRARLGQYFSPTPGDTRFFVGLLDKVLGETGRSILTRLLGVILSALAVQFVADGVKALAAS